MNEEINALEANGTWEITDLPPGKRPLDTKWVYKIKFNTQGEKERHKARLVARVDKQIKGKDYKSTFSPVANFSTVRIITVLAKKRSWNLY